MKRGEKPTVQRKRRTKAQLAALDDDQEVPDDQRKANPEGVAGTIAAKIMNVSPRSVKRG